MGVRSGFYFTTTKISPDMNRSWIGLKEKRRVNMYTQSSIVFMEYTSGPILIYMYGVFFLLQETGESMSCNLQKLNWEPLT